MGITSVSTEKRVFKPAKTFSARAAGNFYKTDGRAPPRLEPQCFETGP